MRKWYDEQLAEVRRLLGEMCECDAEAMRLVERALDGAEGAADAVRGCEIVSDGKEREIERLCMRIIVRQQPVARDLALVTSAVKMVTDLERIADQAADIADILKGAGRCAVPPSLKDMTATARRMTEMCAEALRGFDAETARTIKRTDDGVDGLFVAVKTDLADMIDTHGEDGECAMDMLMIAKYLERVGDHAVNIAEWIVFAEGQEK